MQSLAGFITLEREEFMRYYYGFVYIRIMQALGAYGFRGFYERKPHFLQSVPFALKNLGWLLEHVELPIALPALLGAFSNMVASEKLQNLQVPVLEYISAQPAPQKPPAQITPKDVLVLKIFSFSFHQSAPPTDDSGHGGGFIFDARGLPNPGREERFKQLTGKDAAVIDYLKEYASVRDFVAGATSMVEASVRNYQERGFMSLMVSFGCTGGQHRSVYLAETLAKHFANTPGVEVKVRHLELEKLGK
jgi:hypothetical protein